MEKITMDSQEAQSADLISENIQKLKELFPELLTEGANGTSVNVDVIKELVGDSKTLTNIDEKYGLNWHGKRKARQIALTPSLGTLRPCKEESVDWENTKNLFIEGDNLEVLKLLQKSYANKVKMIYIDPPYNTGKDFVYPDDFRDNIRNYQELTGQTEDGKKLSSNAESSGRFHTDWLNMMYPRLKLARNLLKEDGVIFISIDESEASNLRHLCDDIFGQENFIGQIVWEKMYTTKNDSSIISRCHEYVLVYSKNIKSPGIYLLPRTAEMDARYTNPDNDPRGPWKPIPLYAKGERKNGRYPVVSPTTQKEHLPQPDSHWLYSKEDTYSMINDNRIYFGKDGNAQPNVKRFLSEVQQGTKSKTLWNYKEVGSNDSAKRELRQLYDRIKIPFDFPKPTTLLERVLQLSTENDKESLVLDFFAGSGTLGHSVWKKNLEDNGHRKYIMVQLPEIIDKENKEQRLAYDYCIEKSLTPKISELSKDRLRIVTKNIQQEHPNYRGDLGFRVFKLDSSNIQAWDPNAQDIAETLEEHVEHLKKDRTEEDILYELLLKLGLDLCVPIESKIIAGKIVYSIGYGVLLTCLDTSIMESDSEKLAEGIIIWHKELSTNAEVQCVFRDSAFENDNAKTNLIATLEQHGIEKVRSI